MMTFIIVIVVGLALAAAPWLVLIWLQGREVDRMCKFLEEAGKKIRGDDGDRGDDGGPVA